MRRSACLVRPFVLGAALAACLAAGCRSSQEPPAPASTRETGAPAIDRERLAFFAPLPASVPSDASEPEAARVTLGRMLYYEPRLSRSQTISCNSCHDLANYGIDPSPTSTGHKGQKGDRNSPTVFNAAIHFAQFWDGRAADVEEQAKGPVLNPVEMAMPAEAAVVAVLTSMPEYVDLFRKAFPGAQPPVTYDNMAKAIGAFERRLITPSRWDGLLNGDERALTPEEASGLKMFLQTGCQSCHYGSLLGGTSYQRLGAAKAYPGLADPGRYRVTKVEPDRGVFKVPSLRNVEKTGPYFHDGRVPSLDRAVRDMAEYQLGKTLSDDQVKEIVAFLKVLTGTVDPEYVRAPVLPKSTPATPKPDAS